MLATRPSTTMIDPARSDTASTTARAAAGTET